VHQLDPNSIDIDKVRKYEAENRLKELQYPDQFKNDSNNNWIAVPVELAGFNKKEYEKNVNNLKEGQNVPSPFKEYKSFTAVPPRMIMVNTKWTTQEMHKHIMDIFLANVMKPEDEWTEEEKDANDPKKNPDDQKS